MPTQLQRRTASRTAIIDAAARAVAEQGVERFTISRIAETTGLNRATIYHYYPNRDELIAEALRHSMLRQSAGRGRGPTTVAQRIQAHIEAPELAHLLLGLLLRGHDLPATPALAGQIAAAQQARADGRLRPDVDATVFPVLANICEVVWAVGRGTMSKRMGLSVREADRRVVAEIERLVRDAGLEAGGVTVADAAGAASAKTSRSTAARVRRPTRKAQAQR
ncbi:MAG: TetR/AcrR family transcriptional regulator [Chloroflexi bacterium]|nr:TetR/AcrR family transcriptional regulator [Chloroflexota bacterium]